MFLWGFLHSTWNLVPFFLHIMMSRSVSWYHKKREKKIKLIYSQHWLNSKIDNNDRIKRILKWKIAFKNEAEHRTYFQMQILLSITRPLIWEFYICRCYFFRHMMWCDVMNSFTVEYGYKKVWSFTPKMRVMIGFKLRKLRNYFIILLLCTFIQAV